MRFPTGELCDGPNPRLGWCGVALAVSCVLGLCGASTALASQAGVIGNYAGIPSTTGVPTPGPATSSTLGHPYGVAVDSAGNLYIADQGNSDVEKVTPSGTLSIIAGTGTSGAATPGPATSSHLRLPDGVAVDAAGNVFIADTHNNEVEKVTPSGSLSIIAGTGTAGAPTPGPASSSDLNGPNSLAIDAAGNLYVADTHNNVIEQITPSGTLSIIAGSGIQGTPTPGPATGSAMNFPDGVAVDSTGNLYIADEGNNTVEKVTPGGTLSIVAGTGGSGVPTPGPATSTPVPSPYGVAVDSAGDVFIADPGHNGDNVSEIQEVNPSGSLSIIAGTGTAGTPTYGGPATSSQLNFPYGVAVDAAGSVYIADFVNQTIDRINPQISASSAPPQISGTPAAGQILSASTGSWSPTPTGYAYQWQDCDTSGANCADISGATLNSYTVAVADDGHTLRVVVTAQNGSGSASATSPATGVVPTATSPGTTTTTGTTTTGTTSTMSASQADAVTVSAAALHAGLSASPEGVVSVPLQCPTVVSGVCDASGTLSISLGARSASVSVIAQFAGVQVQAGETRLVTPRLSAGTIAYLRMHGIVRVRVTLVTSNALISGQVVTSTQHVWLYVSGLTGCHAATGSVSSAGVGALRLGLTRHGAHKTGHYQRTRSNGFEHYCIAGGKIRVAYSSRALARARHIRAGRVVVALTGNHHYTIRGVRSGTTMKSARRRLHLGRPIVIGKNAWYFIPGMKSTRIVKAQHGVVSEVGVTARATAHTRAQELYLLRHLK